MLNPFSKYIDCINCGNELASINELTFHTPKVIRCDFCGQKYSGLSQRISRTKVAVSLVFLILTLVIISSAWQMAGFTSGLFALFPLFIIYIFTLGAMVRKTIRF
jgi:DNA-directed RNA polymerase subunit RPC12/RpoP